MTKEEMEDLREEAAFIDAVMNGLKKQQEGNLVMIDCPCGGKLWQFAANIMVIEQRLPSVTAANVRFEAVAVRWMPTREVRTDET